jgi:threonine/homoserine/homoserine lactone efflux protein
MLVFLKGLIIGFLIALPVGPVAILCIHRTLAEGRRNGLISGLGAATADALYGAIAAFGITIISDFIKAYEVPFLLGGGIALCLLGIKTFLTKTPKQSRRQEKILRAGNFLSVFLLTLMNPLTVLAFMAVFAGSGLSGIREFSEIMLITGVFCGSCLWWLALSLLAGLFRTIVNEDHISAINKVAGTVIILFGLLVILQARYGHLRF